eukprot:CAMPEP_0180327700 /NCGR_PEP_ID=MMETSP0988-20121125/39718_1 /TAXON_ID=697907 /ORGANISM="non described non described, Strain CCMP2293" /LENGTH=73 /DNA_ID=CAMNT_0022314455 /DNA_START=9 /DNA_END=227 /DNA_ORIENTATION=+
MLDPSWDSARGLGAWGLPGVAVGVVPIGKFSKRKRDALHCRVGSLAGLPGSAVRSIRAVAGIGLLLPRLPAPP